MLLSLAMLFMVGCGGGGGGGGGAATGATVSGVASKGPVRNGHIQVFEIVSTSHAKRALAGLENVPTDANGNYSFTLPSTLKKGGIMLEVKDGVYKDEATGVDKDVAVEYPNHMRSALGDISAGHLLPGVGVEGLADTGDRAHGRKASRGAPVDNSAVVWAARATLVG